MDLPTSLSFVLATAADAEIFIALEKKVVNPRIYGPALDMQTAVREISQNTFYFIKRGDQIVGTVAYRVKDDGIIFISNVAIDPVYQKQGIARAAMMFLLEKNKQAARIELVTHPENEGAIQLYISLGFKIENRMENYFGDGEPRISLAKQTS